jgi:hypothetical protein
MDVSDPLWDRPSGESTSSMTAIVTQSSTSPIFTQPQKLQRYALANTSSELAASLTTTFLLTSSQVPTEGSGFSQAQTDEIVAAIANFGGGGHLWTFSSFWYIAAIVTALTIMFPLLAGGTFRAVLRFSYNHKNYWHIAVFLIVLGVLIVLDYFIPAPIFLGVFGVPQAILAIWKIL